MSEPSLYERLGGQDTIRQVAADAFDNHMQNPTVAARYVDSNRDEVVQAVTDFICAGTGGPQEYSKTMLEVHRGMNIGAREYMAVLDDILAAMEKNGVGEREQQEMLMIAYSLRGDIMHV